MKNLNNILDGKSVRESLLEDISVYEMANVPADTIRQKYDIWVDSYGVDRKVPHNDPRLKVEFEKNDLVPVKISERPEILSKRKYDGNGVSDILKFIGKHHIALELHFYKKWRDPQILRYLTLYLF